MSKKGPNSYENFFDEPQHYPEHGYVFKGDSFNQESAIKYFVNWLMDEWQWIPRDNRKYVLNEVQRNITDGWVKWHGYVDDNGDMRNGWVLYHEWHGNEKRFRHVYVASFQKHYIEHGHHFEPVVSDWGRRSGNDCLVCGQLKMRVVESHLETLRKLGMGAGEYHDEEDCVPLKQIIEQTREAEKEIGYYDSYR